MVIYVKQLVRVNYFGILKLSIDYTFTTSYITYILKKVFISSHSVLATLNLMQCNITCNE